MSINIAAIVPHSPLLMPTIGKDYQLALKQTLDAYETLAVELAQLRIETIVIIGDHGLLRTDVFSVSQSPIMNLDLKEFGDITTNKTWPNDINFGNELKEKNETSLPLVTVADPTISYIVGVPLWLLTKYLPKVKICPIGTCLKSADDHLSFGENLREVAESFTSRIAIIATNDLSAAASEHPEENKNEFDELIMETIKNQTWHELATGGEKWADHIMGTPWRNILVLGGALQGSSWQTEILSYQAPLGVGLLTTVFRA